MIMMMMIIIIIIIIIIIRGKKGKKEKANNWNVNKFERYPTAWPSAVLPAHFDYTTIDSLLSIFASTLFWQNKALKTN